MSPVEPNYFACTLGEAARLKDQNANSATWKTVVELIDDQAERNPQSPALGFATFQHEGADEASRKLLTFRDLSDSSKYAAYVLSRHLPPPTSSSPTIGLLSSSSADFVLTWLGLMRLGCTVLLLAPQLAPPAISHLCKTLRIEEILVDETYEYRARGLQGDINVIRLPTYRDDAPPVEDAQHDRKISDTAYICHTSGTSSGLPKPIPQTQFGVMGALYSFPGADKRATFSTTPLYHGGFPDCLRAWTSGAAIWFFPEGLAPITGANIMKALRFARSHSPSPVKYFSSVPYVLQMLSEEYGGPEILQSMELVGVGGAALPPAIGDKLVEAGINLLSRMGSAECGFLMSSHRDYENDKDWQFLRPIDDSKLVSFEPRDNGLSELVVQPGWPFLIKTNREDGSYATSDLFEPHKTITNAWRYHSRADAQITLANGKKFDPSPIEGSILASSKLLQDVLIFGSGRDCAGALLFPTSKDVSADQVIQEVWPQIDRMNHDSQSHARITKAMLVVVSVNEDEKALEKSSKGTILRRQAEERYTDEIEDAYASKGSSSRNDIADGKLAEAVQNCFLQVLGRQVEPDEDLYRQGVDSISCIQIRKMVEQTCLSSRSHPLPLNVIYDQGTVNSLVEYLRRLRKGDTRLNREAQDEELKSMHKLAEKYSDFTDVKAAPRRTSGNSVVLTGATGFLGTHIVDLLRQDSKVETVYCLLRAVDPSTAQKRVSEALTQRGMRELDKSDKVVCLPCDLAALDFGLSKDDHQRIIGSTTTIIHSAWAVNFSLRLQSFEDQITSTRNLASLAAKSGARFIFVSSIAAVIDSKARPILERLSKDPSEASALGYSRSKWVAEQVCEAANRHLSNSHDAPLASIVRVGQLCSNESGVWNATEAYPLLLSTAKITGCLPDFEHEALNWLPVEQAAQAVIEIARASPGQSDTTPVYHVLNPHTSPSWTDMLQWLSALIEGPKFEAVSPQDWIKRLEEALGGKSANHPSQALLGLWEQAFGRESDLSLSVKKDQGESIFEVAITRGASGTIRDVEPLDRERLIQTWKWVNNTIKG
ncbi:hypothetical protein FGRMN_3479 [Fusarium graminum]|nr:hypothetical protein FGRMN_3479 [Fusarium graminum]